MALAGLVLCVDQGSVELVAILSSLLPECWDYRLPHHTPLRLWMYYMSLDHEEKYRP